MPTYRISRLVETDFAQIEADSPEEARTLLNRGDITTSTSFKETIIEEVSVEDFRGFREQRTSDDIDVVKRR